MRTRIAKGGGSPLSYENFLVRSSRLPLQGKSECFGWIES